MTNILSHHQLPLARCIAAQLGTDNFRFAVTDLPSRERKAFGWNSDEADTWIVRAGETERDRERFEHWWREADVVICGQRLLERIDQRLKNGKLTFYMSERWWKRPIGIARLLSPRFAVMTRQFRRLASSTFFHFLPISDYSADDMKRIAPFGCRMWRWGYFTATPEPLRSCDRADKKFRVLWAGRMLSWKRVDTLVKAFARLLTKRSDAALTLVGDGPERKHLERMAARLLLPGSYRFFSSQPAPEIPKLMQRHHVYVLPSNAYEGWGAVINEAMAEGCAVLASEAAGAAKSIIRDGENGLLFRTGDWRRLGELLCAVANDESRRIGLAQAGQRTIAEIWSPAEAAERFLSICGALLEGHPSPVFDHGPMSPPY